MHKARKHEMRFEWSVHDDSTSEVIASFWDPSAEPHARTWAALLDRDPALVERVAKAVMEIGNDPWLTGIVQQVGMRKATAALTAILTPPEAEK